MVNMDGNNHDRLLTYEEIAQYLNYSPGTVRNMVSAGTIPHEKLPTGAVRFRRSVIDAWVASGRAEESAPATDTAETKGAA